MISEVPTQNLETSKLQHNLIQKIATLCLTLETFTLKNYYNSKIQDNPVAFIQMFFEHMYIMQ